MMLAHVASFRVDAHSAPFKRERGRNPPAVFTVPECGMVGLTEDQCKTKASEE